MQKEWLRANTGRDSTTTTSYEEMCDELMNRYLVQQIADRLTNRDSTAEDETL